MKKSMRKTVIAAALGAACLLPNAAFAYGCPPYNTAAQVAEEAAMELALKNLWSSLMNTLRQVMLSLDRQELASMKVLSAQITTAAKAKIKAKQAVAEGKISSIAYLDSVQKQMDVFRKYSPQTGQGVDPCEQIKTQALVANAQRAAKELARTWIKSTAASPGRYGDPATFFRQQMAVRTTYATVEDEKLGFGKANKEIVTLADGTPFPLAGADINGSVIFADSSDERIIEAKKAFLNNLAGPPDPALDRRYADFPAAREYAMRKARKDALSSAALYSLSSVASENTPANGFPSKMASLRMVRDMYFGQNALQRWASWASQDYRGLMIDRLKVESALLASKEEQYKTGQRLELLLGALVTYKASEEGERIRAMAANALAARNESPVK